MRGDTHGQVNLARSKARQKVLTLLVELSGRPLEGIGNAAPREMVVTASAEQNPAYGRPISVLHETTHAGCHARVQ